MRGEHSQVFLGDARPFSPVLLDSIKVMLHGTIRNNDF